jgi:hypothetical protein
MVLACGLGKEVCLAAPEGSVRRFCLLIGKAMNLPPEGPAVKRKSL